MPESRGQSVVEFALIMPLLMFLLLGITDMARVYSALNSVEAAAREAADYGAFNSSRWLGDPADPASNYAKTLEAMTERACLATRNLDDYAGPQTACTNPSMAVTLVEPDLSSASGCDDSARAGGPCWVKVDIEYTFDLLVPFGLDFFDTRLGLPPDLTFVRSSIFQISDFVVDQP